MYISWVLSWTSPLVSTTPPGQISVTKAPTSPRFPGISRPPTTRIPSPLSTHKMQNNEKRYHLEIITRLLSLFTCRSARFCVTCKQDPFYRMRVVAFPGSSCLQLILKKINKIAKQNYKLNHRPLKVGLETLLVLRIGGHNRANRILIKKRLNMRTHKKKQLPTVIKIICV